MSIQKEDLKDGMVFEQRDGKRFLLLGEHAYNKNGWVNINDYTKDFNTWKGFYEHGIVIIYRLKGVATSFKDLLDDENLEVIWKRKEPIKLTQFQHTILKKVSVKYKYLSRNSCGDLRLFIDKPKMFYNTGSWESKKCSSYILQELDDFDFIKWEDEKPTNIQELLDNCEVIE